MLLTRISIGLSHFCEKKFRYMFQRNLRQGGVYEINDITFVAIKFYINTYRKLILMFIKLMLKTVAILLNYFKQYYLKVFIFLYIWTSLLDHIPMSITIKTSIITIKTSFSYQVANNSILTLALFFHYLWFFMQSIWCSVQSIQLNLLFTVSFFIISLCMLLFLLEKAAWVMKWCTWILWWIWDNYC